MQLPSKLQESALYVIKIHLYRNGLDTLIIPLILGIQLLCKSHSTTTTLTSSWLTCVMYFFEVTSSYFSCH